MKLLQNAEIVSKVPEKQALIIHNSPFHKTFRGIKIRLTAFGFFSTPNFKC